MLIVSILYHAKSRLMEITDISSDEQGKTVATTGDNLGTRLQFTFDDPEDTLEGYGARVDFDVLLMNSEGMTYKPFIMLNSEGYVDIPDGILSQVKCGKLPIQLVFGKAVGETDYRFNSLNQIELAVNRAINSTNVPPEDVPGVEDAVVQVDYDSEDATFTFTRLDGSLITITLSDLHDDHFEVQTQADLITLDEAETGDTATALDTGVWYKLYGAYDVLGNWYPMPGGATMNGQPVTFPTYYAPIDSGTDGQYLESKGENNAPVWKDKVSTIDGSMQGSNVPTATAVKTYVDTNEPRLIIKSSSTPFFSGVAELPNNATNNDYAYVTGVENNETFLDYYLFTKSGNVGQWTKKYRTYGLGINQISNDWNNVDSSHLPSTNLVKTALDTKVNKTDVTVPATVPTLAWGQTSSLGSVDGKSFQVTMPANPDTDAFVKQGYADSNKNRPLLLSYAETSGGIGEITNVAYRNNSIYANPSTGSVYAQTFFANNKEVAVDGDVVHKTGDETVGGIKTFTSNLNLKDLTYARDQTFTEDVWDTTPLSWSDKNNARVGFINPYYTPDGKHRLRFHIADSTGVERSMTLSSEGWVTAPYRSYSALNTNDVVTIGSLQASTDVVHISGNETISGNKTFQNVLYCDNAMVVGSSNSNGSIEIYHATPFIDFHYNRTSSDFTTRLIETSPGTFQIATTDSNSHSAKLTLFGNSANPKVTCSWQATPGSNDEVLTMGNGVTLTTVQTITGEKTFNANMWLTTDRYRYITFKDTVNEKGVTSSNGEFAIRFYDKNNSTTGWVSNAYTSALDSVSVLCAYGKKTDNSAVDARVVVRALRTGDMFATAPARTYNANNTTDIVTIGSLQSSTDVVHRSGSEVVLGVKTIDRLITRSFYFNARSGGTTNTWRHMATVNTTNGRIWGLLHYNQSQRFGFFEMQLGTTPKWYMFIKKSINIQNLAINYDGNGTYYIMIRTPYSYQSGAIMPLIIQNNDVIDTSIYNDVIGGTIYNDASEFPLANTVYAQFEGLDTQ